MLSVPRASCAVRVDRTQGVVQVRPAGSESWSTIDLTPRPFLPGDSLRTGAGAGAALSFDDGSRVEVRAHSILALEDAAPERSLLRLELGQLRAGVRHDPARRFQVRTPSVVTTVRGTEFSISVLAGGNTHVELFQGLLGVEDNRGHQVLLHPHESLSVDRRGMSVPQRMPTGEQVRRESRHADLRRELGFDQERDEDVSAAARELKLAEYQQGKALVDVDGRRVRVESYVLRPRADQFKLVVLNRRGDRNDYFYYLGTFNKPLPRELGPALRRLGGGIGSSPEYFLTEFETGRSNRIDNILELGRGGHPVDLNANVDLDDNLQSVFDPDRDRFVDAGGGAAFQTLFDDYGLYLNGKLKAGWTGTDVTAHAETVPASAADPITGAVLNAGNAYLDGSGLLATGSESITFPDAERMRQRVYQSYTDGAFLAWDNHMTDGEGAVARRSDFSGETAGTGFRQRLLGFNYEQSITATEFGGRKIDLTLSPRPLIQLGLIQ
ncbi:MAG: hypothetical protein A2X36_13340 [Elusimicrobia bacterium GWA2_69_24]|nr:MAG: hypothetical protein A2X36_13340 [Elusimicrobia bacterium GWA2_69_24]